MNRTSGKFTAQRDGIYVFSFTGLPHFLASSSVVKMDVAVYLNGNWIGAGWADEVGTANQYETLSWQSTMNLKNGDEIWLEIKDMSTGGYLRGGSHTHFGGYLLEENLKLA